MGVTLKILAMEKEVSGVTPERFGPHLKAEAARAWELHQFDVIPLIPYSGFSRLFAQEA